MTGLKISKHALDRMKERCNVSNKSAQKLAYKAFRYGLTHRDLNGKLCRWIDGKYMKYHRGNQVRIYDYTVFVFDNNILITVFPVPENMRKDVDIAVKCRDANQKFQKILAKLAKGENIIDYLK